MDYEVAPNLPPGAGFFRFASATCFGRHTGGKALSNGSGLADAIRDVRVSATAISLPFDPDEVAFNLRTEKYKTRTDGNAASGVERLLRDIYYAARPLLGVHIRKYLQRFHLRGWERTSFPHWPLDTSVDQLAAQLLATIARSQGRERIPFVWFWPDGHSNAFVMTHDVEASAGKDFCHALMDIDDEFGIKASFQVVPEERYNVTAGFLDEIRRRGFEINVHDLNHDGHLYDNHETFLRRAQKINHYLREFNAEGFRSGVMYRNQDWYGALQCSYDMSVPNVASLDLQSGGCCTVMPYFIGDMVELPVTATQDYALFNLIGEYSTDLWNRQIEMIAARHGLISFIIHPDYIIEERAQQTYKTLLQHVSGLRLRGNTWFALPKEVNQWWRQRNDMRIIPQNGGWIIEGAGAERAQIAFAVVTQDEIHYELPSQSARPLEVLAQS
jgi:hypothetical protein